MTKKVESKKTNKLNYTKNIANTVGADASVRPQTHRGITLIALVITIIVMLILVGVTVSVAINGGLFGMAKEAKTQTEKARDVEQELANGRILVGDSWYDSMSDYVNGNRSKDQSEGGTYFTAEKNEDGTLKANATYESGRYTAIIPKGFKVSEVAGEDKIETGLVIQDKEGNEFVWIPVTYEAKGTAEGEAGKHGLDKGFLAVFYRSDWANNERTKTLDAKYTEPYAYGYEGVEEEYYNMMKSVQDNEGFYIGRYEAGSETPRTNKANETTTMVVKRDQYPYNYVGWASSMSDIESDVEFNNKNQGKGAVYLSKHMYEDGDNVGVVSTLCYEVEWDTMLEFIKDDMHNVTNSTNWGNYKDNAWTITRSLAKYSENNGVTWENVDNSEKHKDNNTSILLTTGASDSFAAKNIYDIAGNCHEWTMECYDKDDPVHRGGHWGVGTTGDRSPASRRENYGDLNYADSAGSFRPALYIKN